MLVFKISPSTTVESYFAHQCQRNLLYTGVKGDPATRTALRLNKPDGGGDDTAAHAGQAWEETLAKRLLTDGSLICKDPIDLKRKFSIENTISVLKKTADEVQHDGYDRYIYQGKLQATDEFCRKNLHFDMKWWDGTDSYLNVKMSEPETDFLKVWRAQAEDTERGFIEGQLYVSVIDSKLAKSMKFEHKVQVTMYVRILDSFLRQHDISLTTDDRYGYLWNFGQEEPSAFRVSQIDDILNDYLVGILPETLSLLRDSAENGTEKTLADRLDVCVGNMCEYCEYFNQCRRHLENIHSIQLLPYLSSYAQRYLKRMAFPTKLEDFMDDIEDPDMAEALKGNHSWDYILKDNTLLEIQRDALTHKGDPNYDAGRMWRNARSFHMPRWQDIALIITAQKDIGTDRVYALGYHAEYKDSQNRHISEVFISNKRSEESYLENALKFTDSLYGFLRDISGSKHSLQAYVMDSYEKSNFEDLLYDLFPRNTLTTEQQNTVMGLILWLQGERVITDINNQPAKAIACPIVVLTVELRRLVALPLSISYSLPDLRSALRIKVDDRYSMAKAKSKYNDLEFFGRISNTIPSKLINDYWDGTRGDIYDNYREHLIKRFVLEGKIISRLQSGFLINEKDENAAIGKHLLARLRPFVLPEQIQLRHPLLRKWAFQVKYECLLQCHRIREARQQDQDIALKEGSLLEVEYSDFFQKQEKGYTNYYYVFLVINADSVHRTDWLCGLLRPVSEPAIAASYEYDDYLNSGVKPLLYNGDLLGIVNFLKFQYRKNDLYIIGQSGGNNKRLFTQMTKGQHFYLSERSTDFNTKKISALFETLDNNTNPLLDPVALAKQIDESFDKFRADLLFYSHPEKPEAHFTDSQEEAFRHLFENTVTVLQGPPGTGKTDFIARSVITLCRYYREKRGINLRILISANSHSAIENVLLSVRDKLNHSTDIMIIKADRMEGYDDTEITVIDKETIYNRITETDKSIVVGATCWFCTEFQNKDDHPEMTFDLVTIDEASQVRAMDAMLCLGRGRTDIPCRYLLVGDDDQLPPILQGHYEKKQNEPYIYGSIFRFFRDSCKEGGKSSCCLMLEENFRMNEVLLRYSAEKIYGSRYHAYNNDVAIRHLTYPAGSSSITNEDWLLYVLDDLKYDDSHRENYWPLVFCCISGGDPGRQNSLERKMVTQLTKALKDTIGSNCDAHYFWQGGNDSDGLMGIISPHHVRIEKLKNDITAVTGMPRDDLYIGTVDKLQGQQRDAVIVSYGVTDLESAAIESEFLYNRNRLNVSLTRGRAKTIVFFSEILTTCPPELLGTEDEDIQCGIDFVCGLMPFMQRCESDTRISMKVFTLTESGKAMTVQIFRKQVIC